MPINHFFPSLQPPKRERLRRYYRVTKYVTASPATRFSWRNVCSKTKTKLKTSVGSGSLGSGGVGGGVSGVDARWSASQNSFNSHIHLGESTESVQLEGRQKVAGGTFVLCILGHRSNMAQCLSKNKTESNNSHLCVFAFFFFLFSLFSFLRNALLPH